MKSRFTVSAIALLFFTTFYGQAPDKTISFNNTTYGVDTNSDGSMIFVAGKDSIAYLLNRNGSVLTRITGHNHAVSSIDYFEAKETILTGGYGKTAILSDINGQQLARLSGHENAVINVAQNDRFLGTAGRDQVAKIWKRDGTLLYTLSDHSGQINVIQFIEEKQWIITGSFDQTLNIHDFEGKLLKTFKGHTSGIRALAVSIQNEQIITGHRDGKISILNLEGKLQKILDAHGTEGEEYKMVNEITFTSNHEQFISGGADGKIKVWDLDGNVLDEIRTVIYQDSYVSGIAISDDILISSQGGKGKDASVKIWNLSHFNFIKYTCQNPNYSFLRRAIGSWDVKTKDRLFPGEYEENTGTASITPSIEGCGINISYKGTYRSKPYARSVGLVGQDSVFVQMVALDSDHGSYSVLDGSIRNDQLAVYWYRDKVKKRLQSKYIMNFTNSDEFEFSSFLSQDYGKTWVLTHERKYQRKK